MRGSRSHPDGPPPVRRPEAVFRSPAQTRNDQGTLPYLTIGPPYSAPPLPADLPGGVNPFTLPPLGGGRSLGHSGTLPCRTDKTHALSRPPLNWDIRVHWFPPGPIQHRVCRGLRGEQKTTERYVPHDKRGHIFRSLANAVNDSGTPLGLLRNPKTTGVTPEPHEHSTERYVPHSKRGHIFRSLANAVDDSGTPLG